MRFFSKIFRRSEKAAPAEIVEAPVVEAPVPTAVEVRSAKNAARQARIDKHAQVHQHVAVTLRRRLKDPRFAHKHEAYRARLAEIEAMARGK